MTIKSSILLVIVIAIATLIGTFFLPFEWTVFLLFVVGSLSQVARWKIFVFGSFIPAFIWATIALIRDLQFERSVAELIGNILGSLSSSVVFILVGLTIGIVGGFSTLSGNLIRSIIVMDSKKKNHNG